MPKSAASSRPPHRFLPNAAELTRRAFVRASGVGAVAALAPVGMGRAEAGSTARAPEARTCDVVVIGAGLAGLTAARILAANRVDVLVIEAQDRVGGRTLTIDLGNGAFIDHGGQTVGPGQDRIVALAADLGIGLFPSWGEGKTVDWRAGKRVVFSSLFPPGHPEAEPAARRVAATLAAMADQVPLDTPWTAPDADAWDAITLEDWLADNVADAMAREALASAIGGAVVDGPGQLSLLAALFRVHSGDPLAPFVATTPPDPELRVVGGAQRLCQTMADQLGERVVLGRWASRIAYGAEGVTATAGDLAVSARKAIVAVAPMIAGRIRYAPPLGANRDQLTQRVPTGWVIKVHVVYPSRFWRDDDLSGKVSSDAGPVKAAADISPPDGTPGMLVGFIQGADARRLAPATEAERRAAVIDAFVNYFGSAAATPLAYYEHDWGADEFTRGVDGGYWTAGVWTAYGPALRPPIGPLHWAGSEASPIWCGTMEGAVRSGERVAEEVLAALGWPGGHTPSFSAG